MTGVTTSAELRRDVNSGNSADRSARAVEVTRGG